MNDGYPVVNRGTAISVFNPNAPIDELRLFAGRNAQLQAALDAIAQRGCHIALFGERGLGKTSLANILSLIHNDENTGINFIIVNASQSDTFNTLWHRIFARIAVQAMRPAIGYNSDVHRDVIALDQLAPDDLRPDDVRTMLMEYGGSTVIVVDEVDRLVDKQVMTLFADTIKALSDHSVNTTLILIGVADSVDELITEHQSVERCLVQICMPRMSGEELAEIVDNGLKLLGMTMQEETKSRIVHFCQGLPSYAHLLGQYSALSAIERGSRIIDYRDFFEACKRSTEKAQQSIASLYHKAVHSTRKSSYEYLLLACALASADDVRSFSTTGVKEQLVTLRVRYGDSTVSKSLKDFCDARGPVLQRLGPDHRPRYRFLNPMLQPFVIFRSVAEGLIDPFILDDRDLGDRSIQRPGRRTTI